MAIAVRKPEIHRMFDTHKYIKQLEKQGFKEKQAESIVELVTDSRNYDVSKLATKEQIANLETKIMAALNTKIAETKYDVLKWVIGLNLTIIGLAIGILIKLYLP